MGQVGSKGNVDPWQITNKMSYIKLLKPTITYIQASIKFVKTGKHIKIKYEHIKGKQEHIKSQ